MDSKSIALRQNIPLKKDTNLAHITNSTNPFAALLCKILKTVVTRNLQIKRKYLSNFILCLCVALVVALHFVQHELTYITYTLSRHLVFVHIQKSLVRDS